MANQDTVASAVHQLALAIKGLTVKIHHMEKELESGALDTKTRLRKIEKTLWETNGNKAVMVRITELEAGCVLLESSCRALKDKLDSKEISKAERWVKLRDGFLSKLLWVSFMSLVAILGYAARDYLGK